MALQNEYMFVCDELPQRIFFFFGNKRTEFCDITFKVGERSIKAHRIILAAAIPYFYELFSGQEVADSGEKEIAFPDVDSDALEALIEYAYSCKVKISTENVKALLSGACTLQLDEVKTACCSFLAERLDSENALDIRCYSSSLGCSALVKEIDNFIGKCFSEIIRTENFLNISFNLLNHFISKDELNVKNEEVVYESALKWVKKCPEERSKNLLEILKNIRFPFLDLQYIKDSVAKEELIRSSVSCTDLMLEAIFYICCPEQRNESSSFCISPRRYVSEDQDMGGKEKTSICVLREDCVVECFDLVKEKWEIRMIHGVPSSVNLSYSIAALDKKLYCFVKDVTHVIDLETNEYSSCTGMRYPRDYVASVAHKNKIFICGGIRNGVSEMFECFDPETEEWTQLNPMNTSRSGMRTAAYKEFVYVLGGWHGTCTTNCVEKYNVETGKWYSSPPMLTERCSFGCCTLNDKMYVCGGRDSNRKGSSTAEVFDPISDQWKFIASMNTPRRLFSLVSCCNKVYVLGGYVKDTPSSTVEIYNPNTDEWQFGTPSNEETSIFGAAIVSLSSV